MRNQEYLNHSPKYLNDRSESISNSIPALSILSSIQLYFGFFFNGLSTAINLEKIIETLATSPNLNSIQSNLIKSSLLQIILLISAASIDPLLSSTIGGHQQYGRASLLFHLLFLYPLVAASIYYSGLYNNNSKLNSIQTQSQTSILHSILNQIYRPLILINYLLVAHLLRYIPYLPLAFLFTSLANAYYVFEITWINKGMSLPERIRHLEERWCWYLGFGVPITLLSYFFTNPLISLSIFSLAYSPSLLLVPSAHSLPVNPFLPSTSTLKLSFMPNSGSSSISIAAAEGGEQEGQRGSPFIPFGRVRIFILAEMGYRGLEKLCPSWKTGGGGGRKKDAGMDNGGGTGMMFERSTTMGHGGGWRGDTGGRQQTVSQFQPQSAYSQASPAHRQPQQQQQATRQSYPSFPQQGSQPQQRYSAAPSSYSTPSAASPPTRVYTRAAPASTTTSSYSNPLASLMKSGSNNTQARRTHQASESSVGVVVPRQGSGFDLRESLNADVYGGRARGKGE